MSHDSRRRRDRLPLALSVTALVVAVFGATPLGEAARDALPLPRNSVGTAQLKANSVTGAKVRDGTLRRADFARGVLTTGPGLAGPKGDKGDPGPKGDKGDKGDAGPRTPAWGDADGPGFSDNFSTWRELGQKLTLAPIAGKSGRYFVFGRVAAELQCTSAGPCAMTYALFVNGNFVPLTSATVVGPAGQRSRHHVSVFGVANVIRAPTTTGNPTLGLRYRSGSNIVETSNGIHLGAIALG